MKEKRRLRKGVLSFSLAVIMIIGTLTGIVPGTSIKVKAETATGVWSDGIDYSYDTATGVLTLTANGSTTVGSSTVVMNEDDMGLDYIINEPFSNISRIVISEGITSIGDFSFTNWNYAFFSNDLTIEIPSTVTSIGNWAFSSITNGSVSVIMNARPDNITTFYTNAFNDSEGGEFITPYASEWKESGKCSYDSTNNRITFDNTYQGIFTLSSVAYTVTFKDYDGSVLKTQENVEYNTSATAPDDPTREGYTFTGWDKSFTNITANTEVTAIYTINSYTVKWVNYDDTVLKEDTLDYGVTPEYTGATPTKPADEQYTYTFADWTPEISAVTGDVIYKATYTQTEIKKDDGEASETTPDEPKEEETTPDTPATDTSINTEVKTAEGAPAIKADNLDNALAQKLLTDAEKAEYANGTPVLVYLDVKRVDKANVPADDVKAIDKVTSESGYTYGDCLDISLWKKMGDGDATQVHDTNGNPIKMTVTVPASLAAPAGYVRTIRVVRVHGGEAKVLAEGTGLTLDFSSDGFSSYFLVYKDTKIEEAINTSADTSSNTQSTSAPAQTTVAEVPKTGEYMPIAALIMLILSMTGMVMVIIGLKKKNHI